MLPANHRREARRRSVDETRSVALTTWWLDADVIIDGIAEPLFAAQTPFSCLDAHVTEQELDLFKFPASLVTEARAGSTQIVMGNALKAAF